MAVSSCLTSCRPMRNMRLARRGDTGLTLHTTATVLMLNTIQCTWTLHRRVVPPHACSTLSRRPCINSRLATFSVSGENLSDRTILSEYRERLTAMGRLLGSFVLVPPGPLDHTLDLIVASYYSLKWTSHSSSTILIRSVAHRPSEVASELVESLAIFEQSPEVHS